MLVGTAVGGVLIAWGRGLKSVISAPRSGLAPVFATMVAAIFVATIVNGVALYFMGQAKLGSMVRYKP
jgi:MFS superfamily sulfate permease-like transporter